MASWFDMLVRIRTSVAFVVLWFLLSERSSRYSIAVVLLYSRSVCVCV